MPEPDSLLHVLTARGRITLPSLREISSELESAPENKNPDSLRTYKLARFMDMLGHAEFIQRGRSSGLVAVPACLARLPGIDRHRYVVCGARSAATVEELGSFTLDGRRACQVSVSSRKHYPDVLLPNRIIIEFGDAGEAERMAAALGIAVTAAPAGWAIACLSAGIEEYEASLVWRPRTVSDDELRFYDPGLCGFVNARPDSQGVAQRLDDSSFVCIVRGDEEALAGDLDWARCWAHAEVGTSCLRYDGGRKLFAAPSRLPLPRLLARALALCSGLPPAQTKLRLDFISDHWLVFREIPKEIAFKVADKLGLPAVPRALSELQELTP